MAFVGVELEVQSRAADFTTQHGQARDRDDLFTLSTTDSNYASDLPAFSTTVYNYYNAQTGASNEASTDILYKLWVGGDATGGGTETADGVLKTPAGASDITAQVSALVNEIIVKAKPSNV